MRRTTRTSAPLAGVLGLGASFALAHHQDLPPGQMFTALLGVVALLARALSRR